MLKFIWNKWKKIAERIGNFQTTIIFSLLYFLLFFPMGLLLRFSRDILSVKSGPHWEKMEDFVSSKEKLKEQ